MQSQALPPVTGARYTNAPCLPLLREPAAPFGVICRTGVPPLRALNQVPLITHALGR